VEDRLRAFNRFYSQRVGVLGDHYLGQTRTLGAARVLWEIGVDGAAVEDLGVRLGLDARELSRLLRTLRDQGLLLTAPLSDRVGPGERVELSDAGVVELATLNERADTDARHMLSTLDDDDIKRIVGAFEVIERCLAPRSAATATTVRLAEVSDAAAIAALLLAALADQRDHFTSGAFASATPSAKTIEERITANPVWVAESSEGVVGTVAAEVRPTCLWIRSLAVLPAARGRGIAQRLLAEVEARAIAAGVERLELDTTPFQTDAASLYRRIGFRSVRRHAVDRTPMIHMAKTLANGRPPGH
jgi:N-acetylglutamate synthase-like GNAT family acetyltransferase/DNA-binding MarR family transcriptional regulator